METKIRRLQDHLVTLGTGNIAFGAWMLLKITLYCTLYQNDLAQEIHMTEDINVQPWITFLFIWILIFLDVLFQCFIGFSARADGKGKRKSIAYIVITGLRISFFAPMMLGEITTFLFTESAFFGAAITLFIDLTSVILLVELFVCAIKVRVLKKRLQEVPHES